MTTISRVGIAPRYSDVVIKDDVAYFSGYVPETSLGRSVSAQTQDVLDQIEQSLAEIGSGKDRILRAMIWLADMDAFEEMNAVWDAWVVPGHVPTRACVESRLADPGYALEIQITAAL